MYCSFLSFERFQGLYNLGKFVLNSNIIKVILYLYREGALLMTNGTKRQIVVSTLCEAEFYADNGFDDVLYGVCFTHDKLPRLLLS